jgi:predicted dehydrogenase
MAKKVRIGIVGTGGIGTTNGRAMNANPRGEIVALCDILPERMDAFEKELGRPMRKYVDFRDLCRDAEVDAVFVGTPNQVHVPPALEAVRRDKHVMCTKPLSNAAGPAKALVKAAEAAGVVNMMSLSCRFSPECQYLHRRIEAGLLGDIYYARARSIRRSGIPDWNEGFIMAGGGAFRDMGVHVLDASWWLMGMPHPATASAVGGAKFGPRGLGYWDYKVPPKSYSSKYGSDDYAGGFIRYEGGIGVQVESFWASHMPEDFQVELFGTEAAASMNPLKVHRTVDGAPADIEVKVPRCQGESWANIADHFIACVADGVPCRAPLRHGLTVQLMMEAVLESAAKGKEIRVPQVR